MLDADFRPLRPAVTTPRAPRPRARLDGWLASPVRARARRIVSRCRCRLAGWRSRRLCSSRHQGSSPVERGDPAGDRLNADRLPSASGHESRCDRKCPEAGERDRQATARHRDPRPPARAPRVIRERPEEAASAARSTRIGLPSARVSPRSLRRATPPTAGQAIDHIGVRQLPKQAHERATYPAGAPLRTKMTTRWQGAAHSRPPHAGAPNRPRVGRLSVWRRSRARASSSYVGCGVID